MSEPTVGVVWTHEGDVEITITAPDGRAFSAGLDPDNADAVARMLRNAAAAASRVRRGLDPA